MMSQEQLLSATEITTADQFWQLVDHAKVIAEYDADHKLDYLRTASLETLRFVFHEYRFFIKYFINDLGSLIAKAPFGDFKCVLGEILAGELGANAEETHLYLWDQFLLSIGDNPDTLEASRIPFVIDIMEDYSRKLQEHSFLYGVGLRGSGSECLCSLWLKSAYQRLRQNPNIKAIEDRVDWTFWEIHTGEADAEHGDLIRDQIGQLMADSPADIPDLAAGYLHAKASWDKFWGYLYEAYTLDGENSESGVAVA